MSYFTGGGCSLCVFVFHLFKLNKVNEIGLSFNISYIHEFLVLSIHDAARTATTSTTTLSSITIATPT